MMEMFEHLPRRFGAQSVSLTGVGESLPPTAKLNVLRLLVSGGYINRFLAKDGYRDPDLAHALGLVTVEELDLDFDPKTARRRLIDLHTAAEAAAAEPPDILQTNVRALAETAVLSPLAGEILALAVQLMVLPALEGLDDIIGPLHSPRLHQVLATMLGAEVAAIRQELSPTSALHQSGLLRVDRSHRMPIRGKLNLISPDSEERIVTEPCEPLELLRGCVTGAPAPKLELADFDHMPLARRLVDYLRAVVASRRPGANVLIHGAPGLGKTQLARVAVMAAEVMGLEVAVCGPDLKPINSETRLAAYHAAQRLLSNRPAALIFDEFEDVSDMRSPHIRGETVSKGSLNELLETNPVPTLFITNAPRDIDPAHLRRFDLVIEAQAPTAERRRELLRASAADYVDDALLEEIIGHPEATTAVVERASDVVDLVGPDAPATERRDLFCGVLAGMLQTQSVKRVDLDPLRAANDPSRLYDASLTNADIDLVELAQAVKDLPNSRILLYGAPGTGKTAFGGWLARHIGAPLQVRLASDLLDPYLGQTEKQIAEAFGRAHRDRAGLLIDECESFLHSRSAAERPWQQTMTNEFLVQMETYQGVLVMTTNLLDSLDEAVMRRVDFKIKLDFLQPKQLRILFERYCAILGLDRPSELCLTRLGQLSGVAPGDFALIARQARLRRLSTPEDIVERLAAETRFRGERQAQRPIGFLAA